MLENLFSMEFPMVLSIVNMKLRDKYKNLEEFCEDENIQLHSIFELFSKNNYEYSKENNQFIRR
ncbi:MAG: DUF4250 domain-containing protein [Fusobacteriaceae bacterium]